MFPTTSEKQEGCSVDAQRQQACVCGPLRGPRLPAIRSMMAINLLLLPLKSTQNPTVSPGCLPERQWEQEVTRVEVRTFSGAQQRHSPPGGTRVAVEHTVTSVRGVGVQPRPAPPTSPEGATYTGLGYGSGRYLLFSRRACSAVPFLKLHSGSTCNQRRRPGTPGWSGTMEMAVGPLYKHKQLIEEEAGSGPGRRACY